MQPACRVFLISPPWATPLRPSIQTATLKAFLDDRFGDAVETRTISAHLGIPVYAAGAKFMRMSEAWSKLYEWAYMLAYHEVFGLPGTSAESRAALTAFDASLDLDELIAATKQYLDDHVVPHLAFDGVNVIGFTCNFDQVFASVFCQAYLASRCGVGNTVVLYGGMSAISPRMVDVLQSLGTDAYCVMGEGEHRLRAIVGACLDASQSTESTDWTALRKAIADIGGVFHVSSPLDLINLDRTALSEQETDLTKFPLPDYAEYFEALRALTDSDEAYRRVSAHVVLMLEGSRGCFAKCDFCSLNYLWDGFRKIDGINVAARARTIAQTYGANRIFFTDNVCDTWARSYADEIRTKGPELRALMELRAHHGQHYFTALRLAGVDQIQIGVEAVAPVLMRRMNKGTTVLQNLRAQKFIGELGITSGANLITHHPKSTVEDVAVTRKVLEGITHFPLFNLAPFSLCVGSPIYNDLSNAQKRYAVSHPFMRLDVPEFAPFAVDWCYELPEEACAPADVLEAWDELTTWYSGYAQSQTAYGGDLTCYPQSDGRVSIRDDRYGRNVEFLLSGLAAAIHEAAHTGLRIDQLGTLFDAPDEEISAARAELSERRLTLDIEDHTLTVTFRPVERLYRELFEFEHCKDAAVHEASHSRSQSNQVVRELG